MWGGAEGQSPSAAGLRDSSNLFPILGLESGHGDGRPDLSGLSTPPERSI